MSIPIFPKKPGEDLPIGRRYRDADLKAVDGTAITASSTVVTVSPSGLTLGTNGVVADGSAVYCWVSGGTDGTMYRVRFTTTFSDAKVLIDDYDIRVRN